MSAGWIRVWRQAFENDFLDDKPYNNLSAWIYLLSRVQHKRTAVNFSGKMQVLERGQCVTSVRHLAKQFGWGKKKVSIWLHHLEVAEMATQKGTPNGTVISIVKWEEYQPKGQSYVSVGDSKGYSKGDTGGTVRGQQGDRSNNTEGQNDRTHKGGGRFQRRPRPHRKSAKRTAANALKYLDEKKGGDK